MQENPYREMLNTVGSEAGRQFLPMVRTGEVASVNPLTVRMGNLLLDADELLIDPRLLPRTRVVKAQGISGTADLSVPGGVGAAFANGMAEMTALLPGELAVGDRVAMITPDGDQFIILCKAVGV